MRLYLNKVVQTRSVPLKLEVGDVHAEEVAVTPSQQNKMDKVAAAWKHRRS